MKYFLRRNGYSSKDAIELLKDDYASGLWARKMLLDALQIVEKLYLLRENYREFEMELIQHSVEAMTVTNVSSESLTSGRLKVTRRLVNLLTTARLFVDQAKGDISHIYGNGSAIHNEVKDEFSKEFDQNLSYRVMEQLRNYAQHRSIPVHGLSVGASRVERKDDVWTKYICTPYLDVKWIEENGGFGKADVLEELKGKAGKEGSVDLTPLVREYLSSLLRVADYIRQKLLSDVEKADGIYESFIKDITDKFGENVGLAFVEEDDDGEVVERTFLVPDFISRRRKLECDVRPFDKMFVSSEIREKSPF